MRRRSPPSLLPTLELFGFAISIPAAAIAIALLACAPALKATDEPVLPKLKDRTMSGTAQVQILVQPYAKTEIKVNGSPVVAKLISSDKTLAVMQIDLPVFKDGLGSLIEAGGPQGSRMSARQIIAPNAQAAGGELGADQRRPALILDKADSSHRFHSYVKTGRQPKSIAFLDSQRMVVPLLEDDGVDVIHVTRGFIKRMRPSPEMAQKQGFVEALILADRREVWVSQMTTNAVHIFSMDTLEHVHTVVVPGKWTKVLAYDPQRRVVYASNWASKNVSIIDVASRKVRGNLQTGGVPRGMFVTGDGHFMYAAQFAAGNDDTDGKGHVLKISLPGGKTVGQFGVPGSKRHIVFGQGIGRIFVSDMAHAQVESYDSADKMMPPVKVFQKPNTIVLSPDERFLYVSCRGPNNPKSYLLKGFEMGRIYVLDPATGRVLEWWEGGNQPTGLAVSPDGRFLASSDFLDFAVRIYRRTTPPE